MVVQGVGERLEAKEAATKAAAWLWYMRGGSCARSSGAAGTWHESWWGAPAGGSRAGTMRRESRFKAEAAAAACTIKASSTPTSKWTSYYNCDANDNMWDSSCAESLHSLDLLSFSDRLTRTLSASPSITSSTHVPPALPSLDASSNSHFSTPHLLDFASSLDGSADSPPNHTHVHVSNHLEGIENENVFVPKRPNLLSVQGFVHAFKKVGTNAILKCSRPPSKTHHQNACNHHHHHHQNACNHHYHHHHHHHHYHHFLHHPYGTMKDQDVSTPM